MPRDARAYLLDARDAAALVIEFARERTLEQYRGDPMLRSAVERQFEILGEALNQLSRLDPDLAARVPDLRRIVDFRNVLAHAYAVIDDALVWQAVRENIPTLHEVLAGLLAENA